MTNRCTIYTRISLDRQGTSESPERQEAECRGYAERQGWEVVAVRSDRDLSAFKRGIKRPGLEATFLDLEAGRANMLLVWKLDRLTRQGFRGITPLLDRVDAAGAQLASVQDNIDTTTAAGEMVLGVVASMAKQESENISTRVRLANAHAAQKGRMHLGGSRQFGYDRAGEVVPEEAAIIREVRDRITAGESLRKVAQDLNDRGVQTGGGNAWYSNTVKQMITSPRLAALRIYHEGQPDQKVYPGDWEAILTPDERQELLVALDRPLSVRRSVRRHLLTGRIFCGKCGGRLKTYGFHMKNGRPFERYQCVKQPGYVNCGGVAAAKDSLDAFITGEVLNFLARASLRPDGSNLPVEREVEQQRARDVEKLSRLHDQYFDEGGIDDADYRRLRDTLTERIAAAEQVLTVAEARRKGSGVDVPLGDRDALGRWWDGATLEEQREVIGKALTGIVVNPAKRRGGNKFDTTRIDLRWNWDVFVRAADQFGATATDAERDQAEADYRQANLEATYGPDREG